MEATRAGSGERERGGRLVPIVAAPQTLAGFGRARDALAFRAAVDEHFIVAFSDQAVPDIAWKSSGR